MRTFDEIPPDITADLIRQSVVEYDIHQTPHPYKASTDYDVIIDDRPYPPVAIMGIASALADGTQECPKLRGGEGTSCFKKWEELGYNIVPKGSYRKKEREPKDSISWPEYLEHLRSSYDFDPVNLLSLCLRLQPKRSIHRFLGREEYGNLKEFGSKKDNFSLGVKDWFSTIEVAFIPSELKLYLVTPSLDLDYHKQSRSEMDQRFEEQYSGALKWPKTGKRGDGIQDLKKRNGCASYVSVTTESQCQSVVEWLSLESVPNTRSLRFRESNSVKLKSERPELFEPTSDPKILESNTSILLKEGLDEEPVGNPNPERSDPREGKGAFKRDAAVITWVKQRADGVCEKCDQPAPFLNKDGKPFLEVHHIVPLSEEGEDIVANAVALCPNCHRECHHSQDTEGILELLFSKYET
jgi:hypothetical protein